MQGRSLSHVPEGVWRGPMAMGFCDPLRATWLRGRLVIALARWPPTLRAVLRPGARASSSSRGAG
eukprot:CAMPEP_0197929738 /NCGR_PEP_ID=MMETSP1439-20131203/104310_1 /TAXON_ID=66791 /ORGANISM="Gonyaulax spinifera, Strain CCMP409" /LENGTH=64 /DNA_ID=CAMNT_0043552395 /DNA_START=45 /DNA_END=235 /DNA_ORIENTATION=+